MCELADLDDVAAKNKLRSQPASPPARQKKVHCILCTLPRYPFLGRRGRSFASPAPPQKRVFARASPKTGSEAAYTICSKLFSDGLTYLLTY